MEKRIKILTIEDDPEICRFITRLVEKEGYEFLATDNGKDGLALMQRERPQIVLLDWHLPGMNSREVLRRIRDLDRDAMVIIIAAMENSEAEMQLAKIGCYDFLVKPLRGEEMKMTIKNALRTQTLAQEVQMLRRQMEESQEAHRMIGNSRSMQELDRNVQQASQQNIPVMIFGESGTGKELIARAVHFNSRRRQAPFVCVDCPSIPEPLIESELFGHEHERKLGRIEQANQGTLFLDEIGAMPLGMQTKLLRVIQERRMTRLGGKAPIPIDIRIIAATHQDLKPASAAGVFCEELYHGLNKFPLRVPPLRERREDIQLLAKYFFDTFSRVFQKKINGFNPESQACLENYLWPGNVRELQAAVQRAVILAKDIITPGHLPPEVAEAGGSPTPDLVIRTNLDDIRPLKEVLRDVVAKVECECIQRALKRSGGNKVKTARWLGIDYKTLFNKLKQYQLVRSRPQEEKKVLPKAAGLLPRATSQDTLAPPQES